MSGDPMNFTDYAVFYSTERQRLFGPFVNKVKKDCHNIPQNKFCIGNQYHKHAT